MNSIVDEQQLLQQLDDLKQELIVLQYLPERQHLKECSQAFLEQWQDLQKRQKSNKQARGLSRSQSLNDDLILQLQQESQQESLDRRNFKNHRNQTLEPLIADRKSTRLNSSHVSQSRMPSSA